MVVWLGGAVNIDETSAPPPLRDSAMHRLSNARSNRHGNRSIVAVVADVRSLRPLARASAMAMVALFALDGSAGLTAETVRLTRITAEPIRPNANLLPNPSFEASDGHGVPAGWRWDRRNTDATCKIDRSVRIPAGNRSK